MILMKNNDFQSLLQRFFLERLINQQRVSCCTIKSYKDTFRILLKYLKGELNIKPDAINMVNIDADIIVKFMNYLEKIRKNKCRTVNNRLAAIKSFMEYVSYEAPEYLGIIRKIKAIPFRNTEKKEVDYLTKDEINSLLDNCKVSTSNGRRDYLMILLLYNSGIRVSEMISVKKSDIIISSNKICYLKIMGKGRKERTVPLWKSTTKHLIQYLSEHKVQENDYILSGRNVDHLTRSGVRYRIDCIVQEASKKCLSLEQKTISPHVFRHSTAMSLLQSGVDISTIAIILGHESIETTHKYMVTDLKLKESALRKVQEPVSQNTNARYHGSDAILSFLQSL